MNLSEEKTPEKAELLTPEQQARKDAFVEKLKGVGLMEVSIDPWLNRANAAFGDKTPLELIKNNNMEPLEIMLSYLASDDAT